jgi:hypothetical protein
MPAAIKGGELSLDDKGLGWKQFLSNENSASCPAHRKSFGTI